MRSLHCRFAVVSMSLTTALCVGCVDVAGGRGSTGGLFGSGDDASSTGAVATGGDVDDDRVSTGEGDSATSSVSTSGVTSTTSSETTAGSTSGGDGGETTGSTPGGSATGSASTGDAVDPGCGSEVFQAENVPPNVLFLIDRSGSMDEWIGGSSKWDIARSAVNQVVGSFGSDLRFGLALYPGTELSCSSQYTCDFGGAFVDPAPDTATAIANVLDDADTCGATPTGATIANLYGYAGLEDATRENYLVVITDGEANCGDSDPSGEVATLRAEMPEVKTFVVGFGSGVNENQLNAMAEAGGTALPGDTKYYEANDAAALEAAFADIAANVMSCSYALSQEPYDDDALYVYFDGQEVARDPSQTDGWDYDASNNTITFFGAACASLQDAEVEDLQIVYGCPLPG